jgi:mono/diheme cytochrome c family protein
MSKAKSLDKRKYLVRSFLVGSWTLATVLLPVWLTAETHSGDPRKGQLIYQRNCLRCHGQGLDGQGPDVKKLVRPPTNFLEKRSRKTTDFELALAIKQGKTLTDMHRWDDTLGEQQVQDVIAYIRERAPHLID